MMGDINERELDNWITREPEDIEGMSKEELWDVIEDLNNIISKSEAENTTLKKQLDNQKYLDRVEVEEAVENIFIKNKLIVKVGDMATTGEVWAMELMDNIIAAICNLAIPENKHLNFEEVNKIISNTIVRVHSTTEDNLIIAKEAITAILDFAIKPLTKDRIIKVLERHGVMGATILATEIIEGKEGENDK